MNGRGILGISILIIILIVATSMVQVSLETDENDKGPEHQSLACRPLYYQKLKEPEGNLEYSEFFTENDPSEIAVRILRAFDVNHRNISFSGDLKNLSFISGIGTITVNFRDSIVDTRIANNDFINIHGILRIPPMILNESSAIEKTREIIEKIGMEIEINDVFSFQEKDLPSVSFMKVTLSQTFEGWPLHETDTVFKFFRSGVPTDDEIYPYDVEITIKHRYSSLDDIENSHNEDLLKESALRVDYRVLKEAVSGLYNLDNFFYNGTLDYFPDRFMIHNGTLLTVIHLSYILKDESLMSPYPFDTRQVSIGIHMDPVTLEHVMISY